MMNTRIHACFKSVDFDDKGTKKQRLYYNCIAVVCNFDLRYACFELSG